MVFRLGSRNLRYAAVRTGSCSSSPIDCSSQMRHPFHAPAFSGSVYPANETQACFPLVALDLPAGLVLQLYPFLLPAASPVQKSCVVLHICLSRIAVFWRATQ